MLAGAIKAGELRHRIAIQANTPTSNTGGELIESWADVTGWSSLPAAIVPFGRNPGRETDALRARYAEADYEITMRFHDGITPKHRVRWTIGTTTRYFDIRAVLDPTGIRTTTVLLVMERNLG